MRTLEATAPETLTSFTVEVIVGGVVVETIVMTQIAAEGPTWRGEITDPLSTGFCKINFYYNGSAVANARYHANISSVDGSISYCYDMVYSDVVVDSSGGSGTGARTVVITVIDGVTLLPVENANVRLTSGLNTRVQPTDADGEVTFNVDDATWIVAITSFGYSFPGASLIVNADAAITYELTPLGSTIPPVPPGFCILRIRVWTVSGNPAEGVTVKVQVEEVPPGVGEIFDRSVQVKETAADGYANFEVPRGSEVKYWVGPVEESVDEIPSDEDIVYVENQLGLPTVAI